MIHVHMIAGRVATSAAPQASLPVVRARCYPCLRQGSELSEGSSATAAGHICLPSSLNESNHPLLSSPS